MRKALEEIIALSYFSVPICWAYYLWGGYVVAHVKFEERMSSHTLSCTWRTYIKLTLLVLKLFFCSYWVELD